MPKNFYERERVKSDQGKLNNLGFTLIELLVVISIIGFLATASMVVLNSVRMKARDARRLADARQIQTAIEIYFNTKNTMPINRNPGVSYNDAQPNFLQELVDEKLLANNPKDIQSPTRRYYYYDYGAGNSRGAMITFQLETIQNHPNSCEPAPYEYRVCNPY